MAIHLAVPDEREEEVNANLLFGPLSEETCITYLRDGKFSVESFTMTDQRLIDRLIEEEIIDPTEDEYTIV